MVLRLAWLARDVLGDFLPQRQRMGHFPWCDGL